MEAHDLDRLKVTQTTRRLLRKIALIPPEFDGHFCSDGFLVFRMDSKEETYLLSGILRSEEVQKQMFYSQRESVQPDIKPTTFKKRVLIPFPLLEEERRKIIEKTKDIEQTRRKIQSLMRELSAIKIINR